MDTEKIICPSCNILLDINDFYKQKDKKTGRRSHCKKCISDKGKNIEAVRNTEKML